MTAVFLLCSLFASTTPVFGPDSAPAPKYAHHIELSSVADDVLCSSTAVGPHTLLTAAHCIVGTGKIRIDGEDAKIVQTLYDEQDHVLIVEDGVTFADTKQIEQSVPVAGEKVYIWGWPGEAQAPVYRQGVFEKTEDDPDGMLFVWQLPVFNGDSGSGMISDNGKVIAVVSIGNKSAECGSFLLQFSPDQLKQIR